MTWSMSNHFKTLALKYGLAFSVEDLIFIVIQLDTHIKTFIFAFYAIIRDIDLVLTDVDHLS